MHFWDFSRSTASVNLMLQYAADQGVPPQTLLRGMGLRSQALSDPRQEITAGQELKVVQHLLQALPNPSALGVDVGLRYSFSTYGVWGLGLLSSATARAALQLALRSMPLTYAYCLLTFHEQGEQGVLHFGEPDLAPALRDFLVARDVVAAARLVQETVGMPGVLDALHLRANGVLPVSLQDRVEAALGLRAQTGQPANQLAFASRWLDLPLPQANAVTYAACEAACEQLLGQRRARQRLSDLVLDYLGTSAPDHMPSLPELAMLVGMSERTFKRRLQDEGTHFRALWLHVRQRQCLEGLAQPGLTVGQLAERLGFADLSSFSQACKRWFGHSPQHLRQRGLPPSG